MSRSRRRRLFRVLALVVVVLLVLGTGGFFAKRELDRRTDERAERKAAAEAAAKAEAERKRSAEWAAENARQEKLAKDYAPLLYQEAIRSIGLFYPEGRRAPILYSQTIYNVMRSIEVLRSHEAPTTLTYNADRMLAFLKDLLDATRRGYRADVTHNRAELESYRDLRGNAIGNVYGVLVSVHTQTDVPYPAVLQKWMDAW